MEFKKGIAYVGLCDVWGGKMWFCVSPSGEGVYFATKKECANYIRGVYGGEVRAHLLSDLKKKRGRAHFYA